MIVQKELHELKMTLRLLAKTYAGKPRTELAQAETCSLYDNRLRIQGPPSNSGEKTRIRLSGFREANKALWRPKQEKNALPELCSAEGKSHAPEADVASAASSV